MHTKTCRNKEIGVFLTRHREGVLYVLLGLALGVAGCASTPNQEGGTDFTTRCTSPDVIRCVGFDSNEKVDSYIFPPWGHKEKRAVIDKKIKASGEGSLRFEIPSNSGNDSSGKFMINFSDDFSVQIGEGEEFYVQWRQRFSTEFLDTYFNGGLGWKQIVIGEGDREGYQTPGCTQLEVVVANLGQRGFPQIYHSCGLFQKLGGGGEYYPDEWMTFQVHIRVGTWYKKDRDYHGDSTVQFWVAREGEQSEMVLDLNPEPVTLLGITLPFTSIGYDLVNTNPKAQYGKIYLTPYHTRKSPKQNHPTAYTWYDELIISRKKIPDSE